MGNRNADELLVGLRESEGKMPEETIDQSLKRGTRVRLNWSEGKPTYGYVTRRGSRHPTMNCWWYFVREDGEKKSVQIQGSGLTVLDD